MQKYVFRYANYRTRKKSASGKTKQKRKEKKRTGNKTHPQHQNASSYTLKRVSLCIFSAILGKRINIFTCLYEFVISLLFFLLLISGNQEIRTLFLRSLRQRKKKKERKSISGNRHYNHSEWCSCIDIMRTLPTYECAC